MTGDVVKFKSVLTALAVVYAAKKYMVKKIDYLALKFINKNISSDNVLLVLQHLFVLSHRDSVTEEEFLDTTPSAPPLELLDSQEEFCDQTHFSYHCNQKETIGQPKKVTNQVPLLPHFISNPYLNQQVNPDLGFQQKTQIT